MADLQNLAAWVFLGFTFAHAFYALGYDVLHPGQLSVIRSSLELLVVLCAGRTLCLITIQLMGKALGWYLRRRTALRTRMILSRTGMEDHSPRSEDNLRPTQGEGAGGAESGDRRGWKGIVGFFHPFCNAGGGGERVLWAAIKATQERYSNAVCVVYTGDHDATKSDILDRVKERFNIELQSSRVFFLYLSTRRYVLASTWPHFTLLGQSLGSLLLALDAFSLLVPDIFIDTMGYAYTLALAKSCFPWMPTGAYVHYPTISTDMLGSLDTETGKGLNAGAGKGLRGTLKKKYWHLFAKSYSWVGGYVDVVMTNSSWTQAHIRTLWGRSRQTRGRKSEIEVVFPPVAVQELEDAIEVNEKSESEREKTLVYIAQFRPEKNHSIILRAFAEMLHSSSKTSKQSFKDAKLVLIGSVRDSEDKKRVYELRLLAHELKIKEEVEFICDATWPEILRWLGKSSVGVNGMWNEHFGIGVVEYQAAGLVSVVNDSGGPRQDIVVDFDGGPTGFHASTVSEYANAYTKALSLSKSELVAMRKRARSSAKRFGENEFAQGWIRHVEKLVSLQISPPSAPLAGGLWVPATTALYMVLTAWNLWNGDTWVY